MNRRELKILYILGPTTNSGARISFRIIVEGAVSRGHEVAVLISKSAQDTMFVDYLQSKGCMVEEFDAEYSLYPPFNLHYGISTILKFPWKFIQKLSRLRKSQVQVSNFIKSYKPDIVHTNIGVLRQGFIACQKHNIAHIWHIREYQTKDFAWKIWPSKSHFIRVLQNANVVTITEDILRYFELQYSKNAIALWDGIQSSSSVQYIHKKKPYFLCANRISPEKKVEEVILAFSNICENIPEFKLLIIGDMRDKVYVDKIKNIIAQQRCADRIELRDHQENVVDFMKDAAALIVASRFEGLGRMTLEATFNGCMVIGRATGGSKEIIEKTGGGFLFNDRDELSDSILAISKLIGTEYYEHTISKAQKIAIEECSNESYCDKIFTLYNKALANDRLQH